MKIPKVSYFTQMKPIKKSAPLINKKVQQGLSFTSLDDRNYHKTLITSSKNFSSPFVIDYKRHKIATSVITNQGDKYSMKLQRDIVDKYLLDDNYHVDEKLAGAFVSIFASNAQYLRDKEEEQIEFYKSKISPDYGKNVVEFPFGPEYDDVIDFCELEKIKDDDEYVEAVLSKMTGQERDDLAQELISLSKEVVIPSIEEDALDYTIRMFQLSKNEKGYDFSDLDKKRELAELINVIYYNFGWDATDEISKETRGEDGKIDYKLAHDVLEIMLAMDNYVSPALITPELRRMYSKDENKRDEIFDAIIKASEKGPFFNKNSDNFIRLFNRCFDENGFNKETFNSFFAN